MKLAEDLQEQIQNFNKEDQLTRTKKNIKAAKSNLEKLNEELKLMQQMQVRLNSEVEQLNEEMKDIEAEKDKTTGLISTLATKLKAEKDTRDKFVLPTLPLSHFITISLSHFITLSLHHFILLIVCEQSSKQV